MDSVPRISAHTPSVNSKGLPGPFNTLREDLARSVGRKLCIVADLATLVRIYLGLKQRKEV